MAIALDSDTAYADYGNVTSFSFSHTCSGDDRLLLVSVNHNYTGASPTMTATYNAVSMTFIAQSTTPSAARGTFIFGLLAPDTGTNTVEVTVGAQGSTEHFAGATSFTGVLQTPPILVDSGTGNANTGTTVSTGSTMNTGSTDNCWAYLSFGKNGTTANSNLILLSSASGRGAARSNGSITPAGVYTMIMNKTSGLNCGLLAVSFAPAPEPPPSSQSGGSFLFNFV